MKAKIELFHPDVIQTFTMLEFEVFNYIRQNGSKIPYMTIRELSEEAHVSTTTIVNFCKKLNCDGFSEFKVKYKLWKSMRDDFLVEPLDVSLQDFEERVRTKEYNDLLDQVAGVIHEAKNIIMIGFGTSAIMARYASNYFSILGKFCSYIENPFYEARTVDLDDSVIMMFSVSGEACYLLPFFDVSKKNKMKFISVTNNGNNTMAKLSDYNIPYYVKHDIIPHSTHQYMDFTTQIPVIYIIESLAKKAYKLSLSEE